MATATKTSAGRLLALFFVIVLVGAVGLAAGVAIDRLLLSRIAPPARSPAGAEPDGGPDTALIDEAWQIIAQHYVNRDALTRENITYGAIAGMVDALGDVGHTAFLTPTVVQVHQAQIEGALEGIGAEIQMQDGRAVIVAPIPSTPADRAGLRPGDIILAVDGEDVTDLTLFEVVRRVRGPAGTEVTLTILRSETGETRDYTLTRARFEVQNVTWERLPGTNLAHVHLALFSERTTRNLRQALAEIRDQGLGGVVLDLRNNPGGLLSEAIGVTSQFLGEGNVLLVRDAQGTITAVPVRPGGVALDVPLVVLVNQGTASAAEIVSGALQDAGRAPVIGEITFGTGTVLRQYPLSDGSALLLATQEWLTPEGRIIWRHGLEPDEVVPLPAGASILFPSGERGMTPEEFQNITDTQLRAAVARLTGERADIR